MSVTIIIATYGDRDHWDRMAMPALLSAESQSIPADRIIMAHGNTLHGARNRAAMEANSEWLCFLDADDELDSEYVRAMLAGSGDLRYPRVIKSIDGKRQDYYTEYFRYDNILDGNYMVIGTFVRRTQFLRVKGFRDLPVYEDWDLWIRCIVDGATPSLVPEAYYVVNERPASRNKVSKETYMSMKQQFRGEYEQQLS